MRWFLQLILKTAFDIFWAKKKEADKDKELADTQKENAELKAESAGKDVAHEMEKKELEHERLTKDAESTPEKKDDYDVLRRDFIH
jgi:hypothetical protein